MLVVIVAIILMLVPGLKYIGMLALLLMVICLVIFVKQARDGKYHIDMNKYWVFGFFPSLGTWVVDLFEVSPKETKNNSEQLTTNSEQLAPTIEQAATNIDVKTLAEDVVAENIEPPIENIEPKPEQAKT